MGIFNAKAPGKTASGWATFSGFALATVAAASIPSIFPDYGVPAAVGIAALALGIVPYRYVIWALVIATAFTGFSFNVSGFSLRLEMALVPVALMSALLHGYLHRVIKWLSHPLSLVIVAFIAVNVLSSYFYAEDIAASFRVVAWYALNLLAFACVLALWENDRDELLRALKASAVIIVGAGLVGWIMLASGVSDWAANEDNESGLRTTGVSQEPNILAAFAAMWIFVLISRRARPTRSDWALLIACALVIPLTSTRASLVALAVGLFLLALRSRAVARRVAPLLVIAALSLAALYSAVPNLLADGFSKLGNLAFNNQTANYRYGLWATALQDTVDEHLILGQGTNTFGQRYFEPTDLTLTKPAYLGNLPLQVFYDTGLLGISCLVAGAAVFVLGARLGHRWHRLAALGMFTILAVATSPSIFFGFWLFAALGLAKDGPRTPKTGQETDSWAVLTAKP